MLFPWVNFLSSSGHDHENFLQFVVCFDLHVDSVQRHSMELERRDMAGEALLFPSTLEGWKSDRVTWRCGRVFPQVLHMVVPSL